MRIITDSTCDLDFKFLEKNGVEIVKLKYFFGEDEFIDGASMTSEEFYEKLKVSDVLPTTSQPSPDQFVEVFEKALKDGEEVLGVFLSSELSGTFQSANIAKSMVDSDKIHIVDSKAVTGSLGALVLEAIKLKEQGKTAEEIKEKLEELKEKRKLYAVVATLKYLQMGGRLSKTSAVVGSILNMKPIIAVQEGKVEAVAKVRGEQNAYGKIVEFIKENPINYDYPVMIAHANSLEAIEKFKVYLAENGVELNGAIEIKIGLVVGVHVGEGAVAISYQGK